MNPTPNTPPVAPPPMPVMPPQNTGRRVGTFTLALCLIATGVIILLSFFIPTDTTLYILRFAPLALILLGAEILIANFFQPAGKLRYDILSFFLCGFIVAAALLAATVPAIVLREQRQNQQDSQLSAQLETSAYSVLSARSDIASLDAYVEINRAEYDPALKLQDIQPGDYVQLQVVFSRSFASAEAFANASADVLQSVYSITPYISYISLHDYNNSSYGSEHITHADGQLGHSIWLESPNPFATASSLSGYVVDMRYLAESSHFISQAEYDYHQQMLPPAGDEGEDIPQDDFADADTDYDDDLQEDED